MNFRHLCGYLGVFGQKGKGFLTAKTAEIAERRGAWPRLSQNPRCRGIPRERGTARGGPDATASGCRRHERSRDGRNTPTYKTTVWIRLLSLRDPDVSRRGHPPADDRCARRCVLVTASRLLRDGKVRRSFYQEKEVIAHLTEKPSACVNAWRKSRSFFTTTTARSATALKNSLTERFCTSAAHVSIN